MYFCNIKISFNVYKKIKNRNLYSIDCLNIEYTKPDGWHVIKGDNGFGKTIILKNISALLLGYPLVNSYMHDMLGYVEIETNTKHKLYLKDGIFTQNIPENKEDIWTIYNKFFSIGIGSNRFFKGELYENNDVKTGQYFSMFNDKYSFGHLKNWLLRIGNISRDTPSKTITQEFIDLNKLAIQAILKIMNDFGISRINSDGVFFYDTIELFKLSKGESQITIIIFEMLKQMFHFCGYDIFKQIIDNNKVDLEGIVLIDDVMNNISISKQLHLSNWLTTHFPKIQFIVTTL